MVTFSFDNYGLLLTYLLAFLRAKSSKTLKVKKQLNVSMYRVTGCRFVQVADSYTWSFQACSFTVSVKKKLITPAIKQATVSIIFIQICAWLVDLNRCR